MMKYISLTVWMKFQIQEKIFGLGIVLDEPQIDACGRSKAGESYIQQEQTNELI